MVVCYNNIDLKTVGKVYLCGIRYTAVKCYYKFYFIFLYQLNKGFCVHSVVFIFTGRNVIFNISTKIF